jgi:hypothetical protein
VNHWVACRLALDCRGSADRSGTVDRVDLVGGMRICHCNAPQRRWQLVRSPLTGASTAFEAGLLWP